MTNEELCALAQSGDLSARSSLLEQNRPFIHQTAYSMSVLSGDRVEIDDLMQEGGMALLKAIDLYDPAFGTKFLTYAGTLIKNAMTDLLRAEQNRFEQKMVSSGNQRLVPFDRKYDRSEAYMYSLAEITADPRTKTPEQIVCHKETMAALNNAMRRSSRRDQIYLDYRFGITEDDHTLQETAEHFSLGLRRTKATEKKAISFLRKEMAGNR